MSMPPHYNWYQNPNNLVAVPSVIENVNNNSSVCLPAIGQQIPTDYVLPGFHDNKVVINYGHVHFSGCVDASTCGYNPYIPEANHARHEAISQPCPQYNSRNNLVDLTGFNQLQSINLTNLATPYSTFSRSIEYDNKAFDYDYAKGINSHNNEIYSYGKDYDLEVKVPPVSTHELHDSVLMIPEPNNMSIDKMTRVMTKYCKYDDLRDVIEERHTKIRSESKTTSKRKHIEDSNDLKHLIRGRTEKREIILKTKREGDLSSRLGITSKHTVNLKKNINSNQKEATSSVNKLNKSSKSSHILERKYSQNNIERNPGLLERKTLSKAQKSNLSPDALKRYLAYQRFLRNCYKSQSPSPQKIQKKDKISKDKYSSQLNENPPKQLKRELKTEDKKVKSSNSFDKIKTKGKSNKKENNLVDQKDRKGEPKPKLTNYTNVKSKKGESKVKVTSYVAEKDKIRKSKIKETIKLEEKRKQDEIDDKLVKYLEKKKKRQELKERLFGCEDRKKDKAESEAKLLKYLKQKRKQKLGTDDENQTPSNSNLLNKRDDSVDLRTVLTRKRTKNLSHKEPKRVKTTKSQQENLIITVEQGVNNKEEPDKKKSTASKVKTIKTKRIKLVINIVCPNSAQSDDSDHTSKDPCTSPHQDLSFLDDFNVDEIVDSLNVSSIPINNHNSNKDFDGENICANECEDTQIESISNIGEVDSSVLLSDLLGLQEEFNTELTTNESSKDEEQQLVASNNEQSNCIQSCEKVIQANENIINISDDKAIETSTKQDVGYCDDVYEVIDITDDVNSNVVILEDIIDLDSNEHHKNVELMTKPSVSLKEKAETILQKSNKIIQNLEKDDNEKDKTNSSNNPDQNIESAELIPEIGNVNSKEITNPVNKNQTPYADLENTNATAKEIALLDIKDLNNRNMSADISIKSNDNNIKPLQEKNLNTLTGPTNTKHLSLEPLDITQCHTNSVLNNNVDTLSSIIPGLENNLINILKEHHNNVQLLNAFNEGKNKSEDSLAVQKPDPEIINIDECETKSEKIERGDKQSGIKRTLNNTVIADDTDTTNNQISEPANKSNDESRKITSKTNSVQANNQIEKPPKSGQNEIIPTTKTVLHSVANNQSIMSSVAVNNKNVKNREYIKIGPLNTSIQPEKTVTKNPYVRGIEKRMLEYLNTKFTIAELIHRGFFSTVYKCRDPAGKNYALKIVKSKYRSMSIYKDKILSDLQRSTTEDKYIGILRIIESFNSSGEWCFLSQYYPKNLKQALMEYGKCFHIDRVQFLARQLVAAVTTLTKNQIIHADIKPSHILLNSTNDNLKLCSFDRSDYNYNIRIIPSSGTASYRAPEMILGYDADYRIEVWSTALVMYEMATGIKLFPGRFNNDILYKQLCTLGPLNYDMLENSTLQNMHFLGTKFMRQLDNQKWVFVQFSGINNKLRNKLFTSYNRDWRSTRTQWQVTEDLDKIEMLYKLLQQMLAMDPRHRIPITYVEANEFIYDYSISDKEIQ